MDDPFEDTNPHAAGRLQVLPDGRILFFDYRKREIIEGDPVRWNGTLPDQMLGPTSTIQMSGFADFHDDGDSPPS